MGVSQAIFHKAGVEELENYTQTTYNISYFTEDNLMQVGEIRITPGFHLGMDILFVQGPRAYDYQTLEEARSLLLQTYKNLVETSYQKGYKNILMPSLGTGSYGFLHEEIAKDVINVLKASLKEKEVQIDFVLYEESEARIYEKYLN